MDPLLTVTEHLGVGIAVGGREIHLSTVALIRSCQDFSYKTEVLKCMLLFWTKLSEKVSRQSSRFWTLQISKVVTSTS